VGLKEEIIESLENQKEIFGDELFTSIEMKEPNKRIEIESSLKLSKADSLKIVESKPLKHFSHINNLEDFNSEINGCLSCSLGNTRNKFVFGDGNPNADLMLIGEAPGAQEDQEGIPFVGRAGNLLNDILKAIKFERKDIYIANILKCRPPKNRDPLPSEREVCSPYLYKQIELIKPKVILCLGKVAANVMLNNNDSLTTMRGNIHEINGIKTMVTFHPAALLRNSNWKKPTWEDVQKVRKLYDELVSK
jgi:uracil-DNA glycosylase family 4